MLYLPEPRFLKRYKVLAWPLPPRLLPWMMQERGLGIYVLPQNQEDAWKLIQRQFGDKRNKLRGDSRKTTEVAHYRPKEKVIIMPYKAFVRSNNNPFLHEIGHAVDFLYVKSGKKFSSFDGVRASLHPDKPFDSYCSKKDKKSGALLEQFATGFAAYFKEPEVGLGELSVDDLSSDFIRIMGSKILKPFKGKSRERKQS